MQKNEKNVLWFEEIEYSDTALVGGKNASLGEMYSKLREKGVNLPNGFTLTAKAYWHFLKKNGIDVKLKETFAKLNVKDIKSLQETGKTARELILQADFPEDLKQEILSSYRKLSQEAGEAEKGAVVAVRSSATAEDLKGASFAGQMETYLNVQGEDNLLQAIKNCASSLFTDRAIAYRAEKGFDDLKIALSAGVLQMVRSDLASSGIMFTLDTESGFRGAILINSIYGVGELIVKGRITPDEFIVSKELLSGGSYPIISRNLGRKNRKYVYKKEGGLKEVAVAKKDQLKLSLTDEEAIKLAHWAVIIEEHYKTPEDIEWAKDGKTGELFIVQARPETVHSIEEATKYKEYILETTDEPILQGTAIGNKIGQGKVNIIEDVKEIGNFKEGEVLVTKMTDPDWTPIMKIAASIITDEGSRTCHAAIISRELGIPCIVGSDKATKVLKQNQEITIDCSKGVKGKVYNGKLDFGVKEYDLSILPKLPVKIMVNIGTPEIAFKSSLLPVEGVGLAREEFIIAEKIKVHPLALYNFDKIENKTLKNKIAKATLEHEDKKEFFIKELAEGISQIVAAFSPRPVILRLSDLKTNEYRALIGGELFEETEENPMLGFRGACRYLSEKFKPAFLMELEAIKRVREVYGLKNLKLMVPFCRTIEEGRGVLEIMKQAGLEKGQDGLEVYVMAEIPSNVILVDEFLEIFDGMSIGSNDLTQLTLGLDRDNADIAHIGDERNMAVKTLIKTIIEKCQAKNKYCGICGDAPSTFPDFAQFLMENGIPSISLSPDAVIKTILSLTSTNN